MQRLEVTGAVRPLYGSLGVKGLIQDSLHVTLFYKCHALITDCYIYIYLSRTSIFTKFSP